MNYSSVIAEELKGLNNDQLKSIYRFIQSFKREKQTLKEEISLREKISSVFHKFKKTLLFFTEGVNQ